MGADVAVYEVRHALRTIRTHPAFAAAAVLSLAVGIGASTAIFSVVNAALLKELPVTNPHELVEVTGRHRRAAWLVSYPMYQDLRARQQALTDMYASGYLRRLPVVGNGWRAERLAVVPVTGNFFTVLGLVPQTGRLLLPSDDRRLEALDESVAALSDSFWRRQFDADLRVIGTTLQIGQRTYSIVGIAPKGFTGDTPGSSPDLWVPLAAVVARDDLQARGGSSIAIIGRLTPGTTAHAAAAGLNGLYRDLLAAEARASKYTAVKKGTAVQDYSIEARPAGRGFDVLSRRFTRPLMILLGVVLLLLLISCCNFASLLLARARADEAGVALRNALGATRQRLLWRSLTESLTLSLFGVVAGVFIAWAMGQALLAVVELGRDPIVLDVAPDRRVLAIGVALGLVTGLAFGFAPAWLASATIASDALRHHGSVSRARSHRFFGRGLVIGQIATSLVLAFVTSLMVKSVANLGEVKHGFDPRGVLLVDVRLDPDPADRDRSLRRVSDLYERLSSLSNVEAIGLSGVGAFFGRQMGVPMLVHSERASRQIVAWFDEVSPGYFTIHRIPLVSGRAFEQADSATAPRVAIVNTAFARAQFGARNPLGEIMAIDVPALKDVPITIVGVVGDVRYKGARQEAGPMVYFPILQGRGLVRSVEIRAAGDTAQVLAQVRQAGSLVGGNLQVLDAETLASRIEAATATERTLARLLTAFSVVALLLAFIGLYGLLSYTVVQLTPTIGVRAALGAGATHIASLVAREALWLIVGGVALGALFVRTAAGLISAFLYELQAGDPLMLAVTVCILFAVGMVATLVPVVRALRVDPLIALRAE